MTEPNSPHAEVTLLKMWLDGQFAVRDGRMDALRSDLQKHMDDTDDELKKKVNIEEFKPIRMMAYSTASTILLAVIMAVVNTVIVNSGG